MLFNLIFIIYICCNIITSLNCYGYAYTTPTQTEEDEIQISGKKFLTWIVDNSEIEVENKVRVLNFFKAIRKNAENNEASSIIHSLAGNSYYDDNNNSNRLSFLDTIPNNTPTKIQILSDLNKVANLALTGDTKRIVSLIDGRMTTLQKYFSYLTKKEQVTSIPSIFPIDRKDSLIKFFRRMDNDITKNTLQYLFDIYEAINNSNDIIEADNILKNNNNINHNNNIYSLKSSILNLEDFGAGYRSFNIWLNELNKLLSTLNLDNKPRINELLNYVTEANVSFFKPKTNMLIGSFFYSSRTEDEIDGALLCNGQHINITKYPNFVKRYLETNKVASISIEEWNRRKQNDDNVGLFGYDIGKDYFIVPYIPAGTFISNSIGNITASTKQITPKQGDYVKDQIVNILGETNFKAYGINEFFFDEKGSLYGWLNHEWCSRLRKKTGGGGEGNDRSYHLGFDASKSVTTGDRVMPRTVFENLYIIISEEH